MPGVASGPQQASERGTGGDRGTVPTRLEQLERKESALWRLALFLLIVLAAALALISWQGIRAMPQRLEALPIGLVVLVVLFGVYAWRRSREAAELRGLVRGIAHRAAAPPSEKQLDQLFALVARSQQGYRDLIDTFDDLLFAISLDGEIRAANRSFAEMLGRPFQELIGHRVDEFLDTPEGAGRATAQSALPGFLEHSHWSGVLRIQLKKSALGKPGQPAIRFFDCMLHAMVKDGEVTGITVLARDITQQRENEARFTELFSTLQEGVYFTNPEGKILGANPALVRMLGYRSKEELLDANLRNLYLNSAERNAVLEELEREGRVHGREVTLRRKDGQAVICLDTANVIRDTTGNVVRHQGTLLDITQRREIERRLRSEQEFARRLVDSFPDLIVVLDTHGRYTFVSPKITQVLGYTPEELRGNLLGERTDPEDQPSVLQFYEELISGKRTHATFEYRAMHRRGDWRLLRATASPLFDAAGKIAGVVASARDVTEVKRMEQQLVQSEKLAAMGQMIAGVAHELNNPLTAILGVTELLREQAFEDPVRRQLELTHRQARRAATIVQNLLAFSRPPAPKKAPLHLGEVLQRALQLHEYSLRKNNISVDFAPGKEVPPVVGDSNQLVQVFLNLITNAEQAIREARDHGTIYIRFEPPARYLRVSIQDDGAGIRPEALPRLFDPFFTTKRPGRGTGLGLSISLAIVKEHGGKIEAQPLPSGAVFTVSLPIADQPQAPLASPRTEASRREEGPRQASSLKGCSALVVDDEESICELVREGLAAQGVTVDSASTVDQAMKRLAEREYDAVLCNLNLAGPAGRGASGKEINQKLRLVSQKPVFLFMTGEFVDAATAEALAHDGSFVIQKPFRISEVLAILSDALQTTAGNAVPGIPPR